MQQVSSITRKRLSARAFERLEKAQAGLEELKQHLATLQASGKKLQTDLDVNTQEQERQHSSLTKCRHQNSMLHDRIQDLEAVIQEHEQAAEDAASKVQSLVIASQGVVPVHCGGKFCKEGCCLPMYWPGHGCLPSTFHTATVPPPDVKHISSVSASRCSWLTETHAKACRGPTVKAGKYAGSMLSPVEHTSSVHCHQSLKPTAWTSIQAITSIRSEVPPEELKLSGLMHLAQCTAVPLNTEHAKPVSRYANYGPINCRLATLSQTCQSAADSPLPAWPGVIINFPQVLLLVCPSTKKNPCVLQLIN